MEEHSKGTDLGNVIRIDDERIRDHLGNIVRGSVEETLNALLDAEVRIPTKPAMHSNLKPATCSDAKPAGIPI